jgi:hypothetical protein
VAHGRVQSTPQAEESIFVSYGTIENKCSFSKAILSILQRKKVSKHRSFPVIFESHKLVLSKHFSNCWKRKKVKFLKFQFLSISKWFS